MTSDEQRREVAQKLRDAATECYNYGVLESDVLNILGVYTTDSACLVSSDSVMDVADLIDRPTTTRHGKFKTKYGRETPCCEVCGYSIGDMRWNYCPSCGAEVIK